MFFVILRNFSRNYKEKQKGAHSKGVVCFMVFERFLKSSICLAFGGQAAAYSYRCAAELGSCGRQDKLFQLTQRDRDVTLYLSQRIIPDLSGDLPAKVNL